MVYRNQMQEVRLKVTRDYERAVNDRLNREEREILEKDDAEAMRGCPRCAHPRVPNAETQRAMAEAREMMRQGTARFASVEELLAELKEADDE